MRLLHGTYLQDWLLRAEDDNWRVDADLGGASRAFADIGSHWCDLAEFVSGHRIARLCARMLTALPRARRGEPRARLRAAATATASCAPSAPRTPRSCSSRPTAARSARRSSARSPPGRKNRLWLELDGAEEALAFDQEEPETLWVRPPRGRRRSCSRDPEHLSPAAARLATLPAGHPQGYADCFDASSPTSTPRSAATAGPTALPIFADGLRAAQITDAVLASAREERWVDVAAAAAWRWRDERRDAAARGPRPRQAVPRRARARRASTSTCAPGEVHCLLGPNGAGKSTLIKCVSGVVAPTEGEILVDGEPLPAGEPTRSLAAGVATIYQELDLVEDLRVAESIFLGHEPRRGPLLDRDRDARARRPRCSSASTTRTSRPTRTCARCGPPPSRSSRSRARCRSASGC